jgi:hypothetical protein
MATIASASRRFPTYLCPLCFASAFT